MKINKSYLKYLKIALRVLSGLIVAFIVCRVDWGLDRDLFDLLFKLKGTIKANPNVALITIDDKSLASMKKLMPLPVSDYAKLLDVVCSQKPSSVGFDMEFNYEVGSKDEYKKLAKIILDRKCITLWGRSFIEGESVLKPVPAELPYSDWQIFGDFKREGKSPKRHEQVARVVIPYWYNGRDVILHMDFKAAEIFLGRDLIRNPKNLDDWYEFLTYYAGPAGTYRTIPMIDVLEGKVPNDFFKGKVVFIGRGEKEFLGNYIRTPFYSGALTGTLRVEVHANVFDTIINGREILIGNKHISYVITFVLAALTVFILFGTSPLAGILIVLAQFFFLMLLGLIFLKFRYYVSMVQPLVGVFISYYILIPYRLFQEYRKRWEYQEAHKLLSEVERMKSNFLSLVTHDLKTPIARIQGLAETMLREEAGKLEERQTKPVKAIIKNSEELNNFISRILNLSQIEGSKVKLNLTSRDMNALIQETVEKFKYISRDRDVVIETDLDPLFSIKMDDQLIGQVIYNLLDNAIKYSSRGNKIRIESWEEENFVKVAISDTGIGIRDEDLKSMFTKFFRAKDPRISEVKGSGLGLYLVKYFLELHGGTISVESEVNKGSTFTLSLPVIMSC